MLTQGNRRIAPCFFAVFVALCLGLFLNGCSKEKPNVYRVGILIGFIPFERVAEGFRDGMAELGFREGQNIEYDIQKANVDPSQFQAILEKFAADRLDLVFTFPTAATMAAKKLYQNSGIPTVFAMAALEGNNIVASVTHPGGTFTGVRYPGPDLTLKRLEILQKLVPDLKRLYITYNPNYPANMEALAVLRPKTQALGITLLDVPVHNVKEIQDDFEARSAAEEIGLDAIFIMPDDISQSSEGWRLIVDFAARFKVPVSGSSGATAQKGALFSYNPDIRESGRLAATLAAKILKGTPAGEIPVVTPESYLELNYKRAQEIGLIVPEELMGMAMEIIR